MGRGAGARGGRRPAAAGRLSLRTLGEWLAAHPRLAEAGWAVLVLLPLLLDAVLASGRAGPAAVLVTAAPLLARHRRPLAATLVVAALALAAWPLLDGRPAFPAVLVMVAVLSLALERGGWQLRAGVGGAVVVLLVLAATDALARSGVPWVAGGPPSSVWAAPVVTGPLLAAAALAGTTLRVRREQVRLLEERADRLRAERDQQALTAAAAERARIAGELHDVVAHALTVVVRLGDAMVVRAARDPSAAADPVALGAVTSTARQALGEVRRLVAAVGPAVPQGEDSLDSLDSLDDVVAGVRAAGLPVRVTRQGPQDGWGRATHLAVHRIVTQSLSNTLEHAGLGARAEVLLRCDGEQVEVLVTDDGVGVGVTPGPGAAAAAGRGRGLASMRERATAFGGSFSAGPVPSGGWRVRAVVPVQQGGGP